MPRGSFSRIRSLLTTQPLFKVLLPLFVLIILSWGFLILARFLGAPSQILVSNITDQGVTVSYLTQSAVKGSVSYYPVLEKDQKQTVVEESVRQVHSLDLTNLQPGTKYGYTIKTGLRNKKREFKTASLVDNLSSPRPIFGQVYQQDGETSAGGVLVTLQVMNPRGEFSHPLSTLTNESGMYTFDLGNLRKEDLSEFFSYQQGDKEILQVIGMGGVIGEEEGRVGLDQPLVPITVQRTNSQAGLSSEARRAKEGVVNPVYADNTPATFTTTLQGYIYGAYAATGETEDPLSGATVYIATGDSTTTDATGFFQFENLEVPDTIDDTHQGNEELLGIAIVKDGYDSTSGSVWGYPNQVNETSFTLWATATSTVASGGVQISCAIEFFKETYQVGERVIPTIRGNAKDQEGNPLSIIKRYEFTYEEIMRLVVLSFPTAVDSFERRIDALAGSYETAGQKTHTLIIFYDDPVSGQRQSETCSKSITVVDKSPTTTPTSTPIPTPTTAPVIPTATPTPVVCNVTPSIFDFQPYRPGRQCWGGNPPCTPENQCPRFAAACRSGQGSDFGDTSNNSKWVQECGYSNYGSDDACASHGFTGVKAKCPQGAKIEFFRNSSSLGTFNCAGDSSVKVEASFDYNSSYTFSAEVFDPNNRDACKVQSEVINQVGCACGEWEGEVPPTPTPTTNPTPTPLPVQPTPNGCTLFAGEVVPENARACHRSVFGPFPTARNTSCGLLYICTNNSWQLDQYLDPSCGSPSDSGCPQISYPPPRPTITPTPTPIHPPFLSPPSPFFPEDGSIRYTIGIGGMLAWDLPRTMLEEVQFTYKVEVVSHCQDNSQADEIIAYENIHETLIFYPRNRNIPCDTSASYEILWKVAAYDNFGNWSGWSNEMSFIHHMPEDDYAIDSQRALAFRDEILSTYGFQSEAAEKIRNEWHILINDFQPNRRGGHIDLETNTIVLYHTVHQTAVHEFAHAFDFSNGWPSLGIFKRDLAKGLVEWANCSNEDCDGGWEQFFGCPDNCPTDFSNLTDEDLSRFEAYEAYAHIASTIMGDLSGLPDKLLDIHSQLFTGGSSAAVASPASMQGPIIQDVIKDPSGVRITLNPGWNLIASAVETETSFLVSRLAVGFSGGGLMASSWMNGRWEAYIYGLAGNDFSITSGQPVMIKSSKQQALAIEGNQITQPVPLKLEPGMNLVSVPYPVGKYTAESLIDAINQVSIGAVTAVSSFESGLYQTLSKINNQTFGSDFPIFPNQGYFIRAERQVSFTP